MRLIPPQNMHSYLITLNAVICIGTYIFRNRSQIVSVRFIDVVTRIEKGLFIHWRD